MRTACVLLLATTSAASLLHAQTPLEIGRRTAAALEAREITPVWPTLTPFAQATFRTRAAVNDFLRGAIVGEEICTENEAVVPDPSGVDLYQKVVTFSSGEIAELTVAVAPTGQVAGLRVVPQPGRSRCVQDYQTKTPLRLPFDGEWFVIWGGRTAELNYHVNNSPDQVFAYDLCARVDGKDVIGDPNVNASYPCYDRPILAPAAGTVVDVVDGIPENVPQVPNPDPRQATGNRVIIDHGNGEFSLLAHLIPGSIRVHPGDHVVAGDIVGHCGNSGHSTQPHLHYQLMAAPRVLQGSLGLPAEFRSYRADGQLVPSGEPLKGQVISVE